MKCKKCFEQLSECRDCNGGRARSFLGDRLTCSSCRSTGMVCRTHGAFWN